jgi:hypothetical protein
VAGRELVRAAEAAVDGAVRTRIPADAGPAAPNPPDARTTDPRRR